MDGSQLRKTGFEKELVYTKVVVRGKAVELLLKCVHMNDFGGTADDLETAIDAVMEEYGVSDRHLRRLISVCCDGINMGKYNGVVSQLKHVRLWLLIIHCVNHRLELAVKDSLREDPAVTEVSEVLLALYYLTRNSGTVKSLLAKIALELNVVCVAFVKSKGTRFQYHKYRALKALIVNYLLMYLLMEHYTCAGSKLGDSSMRSKMVNWLELFRKYKSLLLLQNIETNSSFSLRYAG